MEREYLVALYKDGSKWIIADVPTLGISTEGVNVENALAMAHDAIALYLEAVESGGGEIPASDDFDTSKISKTFSGAKLIGAFLVRRKEKKDGKSQKQATR